jgi:hypothetical protein
VAIVAMEVALIRGWWDTGIELLIFDVLLNAYPLMSLRFVRARAARATWRPTRSEALPSD